MTLICLAILLFASYVAFATVARAIASAAFILYFRSLYRYD